MRLSRGALVSAKTPGVSSSASPMDWAKMSAKPSSSTRPVAPGTRSSSFRAASGVGAVGVPCRLAVTMISSCRWPIPFQNIDLHDLFQFPSARASDAAQRHRPSLGGSVSQVALRAGVRHPRAEPCDQTERDGGPRRGGRRKAISWAGGARSGASPTSRMNASAATSKSGSTPPSAAWPSPEKAQG